MDTKVVSAKGLEDLGIIKRRTALRMAQIGLIPHLRFGEKQRAVGFIPSEVIEALKARCSPHRIGEKAFTNTGPIKSLASK